MFSNLRADINRCLSNPRDRKNIYLLFEQGIWAIVVYRFGCWVHDGQIPLISFFLKVFAFLLFKLIEMLTGISIPASARIGKGFYIGHFGGVILHSDVVLGERCSIGPGVVIGTRGLGREGVPVIGNNVYIGVGAKILGPVRIGNDVRIGANTVVLSNVPDGATVVGIPARIVEKN